MGDIFVYLGNREAVQVSRDPDGRETRTPLPGKRCTSIRLEPGLSLMQAAHILTYETGGVWRAHSDADKPAWVASTDAALAQLLASHWGCELRQPEPEPGQVGAVELADEVAGGLTGAAHSG